MQRTTTEWTQADLSVLRSGEGRLSATTLSQRLGKSPRAVRIKADSMGVVLPVVDQVSEQSENRARSRDRESREGGRFRSDADERILKRKAGNSSREVIAAKPGRHVKVVQKKARRMGSTIANERNSSADTPPPFDARTVHTRGTEKVTKGRGVGWSEEEIRILRSLAGRCTIQEIAGTLGRAPKHVRRKAHALNLPVRVTRVNASPGVTAMTNARQDGSLAVSTRVGTSVLRKAAPGRGEDWTEEEEAILKEMIGLQPVSVIAQRLGRTNKAIRRKAQKFGMSVVVTTGKAQLGIDVRVRWTTDEDDVLRNLAGTCPIAEIARNLNRTEKSVVWRASQLGVSLRMTNNLPGRPGGHEAIESGGEGTGSSSSNYPTTQQDNYGVGRGRGTRIGWTPDAEEELRELVEKGMPVSEIAKRLGRNSAAVYGKGRALGLSFKMTQGTGDVASSVWDPGGGLPYNVHPISRLPRSSIRPPVPPELRLKPEVGLRIPGRLLRFIAF